MKTNKLSNTSLSKQTILHNKEKAESIRKFALGQFVQISKTNPFIFDKLINKKGVITGFINEFYEPTEDENIEWLLKYRKGCYKVSFGVITIYVKGCSLEPWL